MHQLWQINATTLQICVKNWHYPITRLINLQLQLGDSVTGHDNRNWMLSKITWKMNVVQKTWKLVVVQKMQSGYYTKKSLETGYVVQKNCKLVASKNRNQLDVVQNWKLDVFQKKPEKIVEFQKLKTWCFPKKPENWCFPKTENSMFSKRLKTGCCQKKLDVVQRTWKLDVFFKKL